MSNLREEETYSTIFTSLKHSIRRKILRMLYESPRSFSEMQETFRIESSHLTYHLENLGELVYKTDDGRYRLSTFGEAAVTTMMKVEEVRNKKRFWSLPIKWKSFFVLLTIGLVVLAGVSYNQYWSLNRLSTEHEQLSTVFEELSLENQQLSAENQRVNEANLFLESKYNGTMEDLSYLGQLYNGTMEDLDDLGQSYDETMEDLDYLGKLYSGTLGDFNTLGVLHEKILEDFNSLGQLHNDTLEDLSYVWQLYNETMNDFNNLQLLYNETLTDRNFKAFYLQKTIEWGRQFQETLQKLFDYLEFNAKFTGDVYGTGRVWCEANGSYDRALTIHSNFSLFDFELTFNSTFGAAAGTHVGHLNMRVSSIVNSTAYIHYTYGPDENNFFYRLSGIGTVQVSSGPELLRIDTTGNKFTLVESWAAYAWPPYERTLWEGFPSFIVEVNISGT